MNDPIREDQLRRLDLLDAIDRAIKRARELRALDPQPTPVLRRESEVQRKENRRLDEVPIRTATLLLIWEPAVLDGQPQRFHDTTHARSEYGQPYRCHAPVPPWTPFSEMEEWPGAPMFNLDVPTVERRRIMRNVRTMKKWSPKKSPMVW